MKLLWKQAKLWKSCKPDIMKGTKDMPQLKKIAMNNTTVVYGNGTREITLHATKILVNNYMARTVQFDNGGYYTATTKNRMNQALHEWGIDLQVFAEKGQWYVQNTIDKSRTAFTISGMCLVTY